MSGHSEVIANGTEITVDNVGEGTRAVEKVMESIITPNHIGETGTL